MSFIYWLEVLKSAKQLKHLSNHFVLKGGNRFMVFTSSTEVKGTKTKFISSTNIEGKQQAQYIYNKVHEVDIMFMVLKVTQKGTAFFANNHETLEPIIRKLTE